MKVGKSSVGICDVIKKPPTVAYFIKTGGDWNSLTETHTHTSASESKSGMKKFLKTTS